MTDKELDEALDNVGVFLGILSGRREAQEVSPQLARDILAQYKIVAAARRAREGREEVCGVYEDVKKERQRQDEKWGEQNHRPFTYLTVLMEEVGEAAQAALHLTYGGPAGNGYREELVHVAAVAVAMIESYDRGKDCYCLGCGLNKVKE